MSDSSPPTQRVNPEKNSGAKDEESALVHSPPDAEELHLGLRLAAAVTAGLLFGIALYKAGVYDVHVIRNQFLFKDFSMLKIFLTGATGSVMVLAILRLLPATAPHVHAAGKGYQCDGLGVPSAALGAFFLGVGMAISGSCPGTVYVQAGALMWQASLTFSGMLVGALTFGLIAAKVKPFTTWAPLPAGKRTLPELLGARHEVVAAVVCVLMGGAIALIEALSPAEFAKPATFFGPRWNPILAGLLIGLLQVPLTLALDKNAGASSVYVTVSALVLQPVLKGNEYFEKKRWGMKNWWQVLYAVSAVLGSFLVVATADAPAYRPVDFPAWQPLVGGFFATFGARMASGCTSGHGISGMGHLSLRSMISVGTMFLGGIVTAFIMDA